MSDRDGQVERIALDALDVDIERREAFVRTACGGDAALVVMVLGWLSAHDRASGFLDRPMLAAAPSISSAGTGSPMAEGALPDIPGFSIHRELGRGGMGVVYLAQQRRPGRPVALKVVLPGAATDASIRRFEREAEVLGRLQHPGIARVYEVGTALIGGREQPYIAMELVHGAPLLDHLNAARAGVRRRVEVLVQVCEAVEHAHRAGIVHRDLKPGNVLVDSSGQPKVLDFGVARVTSGDIPVASLQTEVGQLVGTLAYMSPEQVRGDASLVDGRADVYALGVMLYEALTGALPHDLRNRSIPDAARIIAEDEPTPLTKSGVSLPSDLRTIVLKALEKLAVRRYPSAALLAADLRHFLAHEPIVARPVSSLYQMRKFAVRNRALVSGVLATMAALLAGTIVAVRFAISERHRRQEAEWHQYVASLAGASAALDSHSTATAEQVLNQAPPPLRGWEWDYLHAACDSSLIQFGSPIPSVLIATSRDGSRLAAVDHKKAATAYNTIDGAVLGRLDLALSTNQWLAVSAESLTIAERTSSGIDLRSLRDGHHIAYLPSRSGGSSMAEFDPEGKRILIASEDHSAILWSVATGLPVSILRGCFDAVSSAAFSPDGSRILTSAEDGTTCLWDTRDGRSLLSIPGLAHNIQCSAFSPDGCLLAFSSGMDRTVQIWNMARDLEPTLLSGLRNQVSRLRFNDDGTRLVTASTDGTARVWDLATGTVLLELLGHDRAVSSAGFSPDGRIIATTSKDHTVRTWDAQSGHPLAVLLGHAGPVERGLFTDGGRRLVTVGDDGSARTWSASCPGAPATLCADQHMNSAGFSKDGSLILTCSSASDAPHAGFARLWDSLDFRCRSVFSGNYKEVWGACLSPDLRTLATAGEDGSVRIWDVAQSKESIPPLWHHSWVESVALDPAGNRVVSASGDMTAQVWDVATGNRVVPPFQHGELVRAALFIHDGSEVVTGSETGVLRVWNLKSPNPIRTIPAHEGHINSIALSPDARHILSCSDDHSVRVWDVDTWALSLELAGHTDRVMCAAYSPDLKRIATASWDESVRLWDPQTGQEVAVLRVPPDHQKVNAVAFSPDGKRLLVTSETRVLIYESVPWRERSRE
jgi:WD40 repeat protein/predicted Ser/Thr protein kinase